MTLDIRVPNNEAFWEGLTVLSIQGNVLAALAIVLVTLVRFKQETEMSERFETWFDATFPATATAARAMKLVLMAAYEAGFDEGYDIGTETGFDTGYEAASFEEEHEK